MSSLVVALILILKLRLLLLLLHGYTRLAEWVKLARLLLTLICPLLLLLCPLLLLMLIRVGVLEHVNALCHWVENRRRHVVHVHAKGCRIVELWWELHLLLKQIKALLTLVIILWWR
jgi:hypothetical protein